MAKLLVLSLAETTSDIETGYAVIARNLDENSWVIIPTLPKELLFINGKYAWDILAITEADIIRKIENRSDVYEVAINNYSPFMIEPPIKSNKKRREILESLSNESILELQNSSSWVGILKKPRIEDLFFTERKRDNYYYNVNETFFWECRLNFSDENGYKWRYKAGTGVAVKDKRFKAYWKDIMNTRRDLFQEKKNKWIDYMNNNETFLLIEFYPNTYLGSVAVVSGVLSINNNEMRRDS